VEGRDSARAGFRPDLLGVFALQVDHRTRSVRPKTGRTALRTLALPPYRGTPSTPPGGPSRHSPGRVPRRNGWARAEQRSRPPPRLVPGPLHYPLVCFAFPPQVAVLVKVWRLPGGEHAVLWVAVGVDQAWQNRAPRPDPPMEPPSIRSVGASTHPRSANGSWAGGLSRGGPTASSVLTGSQRVPRPCRSCTPTRTGLRAPRRLRVSPKVIGVCPAQKPHNGARFARQPLGNANSRNLG
jgi:hypothetical protein